MGEVKFNSPICELWYHGHVSSDRVSVDEPHFERLGGYNFYLLNCEADIKFKGVTAVEAKSLFYLKDYRDYGREVKVRGLLSMGGNLVNGENSDASLILDVLRPHSFIQFYKWGDINLVKSVGNNWGIDTIYVDSENGDDTFVGFRNIRPLKTLTHVKKLCELFNVKIVNIMSEITIESGTTIPNEIKFTGSKINLAGILRVTGDGFFDIDFRNSEVLSLSSASVLVLSGRFNYGKIGVTANIDSPNSTLIQAAYTLDSNVYIRNNFTKLAYIAYSHLDQPSSVAWNVFTPNYFVTHSMDGGAYFKSISSNLCSSSLEVTAEALAANSVKNYELQIKIANPGMMSSATHTVYIDALSYTSRVKSNGTVDVTVSNKTNTPIQIPAGNIIAKVY